MKSEDAIKKVTTELSNELLREQLWPKDEVAYRPVPDANASEHSTWRVRFELSFDSRISLGLDINGEVALGRSHESNEDVVVDMGQLADAEQLGVSRRHALLRPSDTKLYILDLESTNGTWLNNHSIGVNMPYSLSNGDLLRLGRLEFVVKIIKQPQHSIAPKTKVELVEALPPIARAIVSNLDLKAVLKQSMEMVAGFTPADEITVWLVDEQTGELFLEAGRGMNEEQITRMPVSNTLAGTVIKTGKPLRASRQIEGEQIKLKTGYLVDAILYVPLSLGGVTFGVIAAAHRENGKSFTVHDEQVMAAIADFTAIAVQNARVFQATQQAFIRHSKIVTALSHTLSFDLKNVLKSVIGHASLLEGDASLNEEGIYTASQIVAAGNRLALMMDQLIEAAALCENPTMRQMPVDLADIVSAAVDDLQFTAAARAIRLDFQMMGEPCRVLGDDVHLYRSVRNLVDNAIRYSPEGAQVSVTLVFGPNDFIIRVSDTGPGLPEDDLPYLFDRYYRGSQEGQAGLGLGLEIVRATVQAHRGTIVARNNEDHGAEFIITLPGSLREG